MFLFLLTLNHRIDTGAIKASSSYNGVKMDDDLSGNGKEFNLYQLGKRYTESVRLRQTFDSLPAAYHQPVVQEAFDSLIERTYGNDFRRFSTFWETANAQNMNNGSTDSIDFNIGFKRLRIAIMDAFQSDAETIIEKYGMTNWLDQVLLRQGLKTMEDPSTLMKSYLGSLAWTILVLIGLMAGIMTLLYWRQDRYYVEHFMFLLHEHTGYFLLLTLAFWFSYLIPLGWMMWLVVILWLILAPFLAMYRFYGQGIGITLLKGVVYLVFYTTGFFALFVLGLLIVFFLF